MKKRLIIRGILAFLFFATLSYALISFCALNINALEWHEVFRVLYCALILASLIMGIAFSNDE